MEPITSPILAMKVGHFERHYTTCRGNNFRFWKIGNGTLHRTVQFIYGQVFKPTQNLNNEDVKLLPRNSRIQFCGTYRYIELSEYIFESEQEVFISFFLSDYYVIHPYHYCTVNVSFNEWINKRSNWQKLEDFPDLRGEVIITFHPLLRLLFSISMMDNKLTKIP